DNVTNHVGMNDPWLRDHWDATVHVNLGEVLPADVLRGMDDREFFSPEALRSRGVFDRLNAALSAHQMGFNERDPSRFPFNFFVFYTQPGVPESRILIAHGRDANFGFLPYVDTAQLDYTHPAAREYVLGTIRFWAERGIKVRADMAHLVTRAVFKDNWYPWMSWEEFSARWPREFWEEVRDTVLADYPAFDIMMEAYEPYIWEGRADRAGWSVLPYLRSLHPRIEVYDKGL